MRHSCDPRPALAAQCPLGPEHLYRAAADIAGCVLQISKPRPARGCSRVLRKACRCRQGPRVGSDALSARGQNSLARCPLADLCATCSPRKFSIKAAIRERLPPCVWQSSGKDPSGPSRRALPEPDCPAGAGPPRPTPLPGPAPVLLLSHQGGVTQKPRDRADDDTWRRSV